MNHDDIERMIREDMVKSSPPAKLREGILRAVAQERKNLRNRRMRLFLVLGLFCGVNAATTILDMKLTSKEAAQFAALFPGQKISAELTVLRKTDTYFDSVNNAYDLGSIVSILGIRITRVAPTKEFSLKQLFSSESEVIYGY